MSSTGVLPAEYADHNTKPAMVHVHILDKTVKIAEGTVDNPDAVTFLELGLDLRNGALSQPAA